ncbi:hypothetical protein P280DRAFT_482339 [Massarina eburnea CBS 473.64]|uniref:Uncharacterized protein n=1 Tax=Massarina eburnea CBS 473.64 TaxID=1395130 RepID=A0A6A6RRB3_9PLEO|nr:hypothetical protein P280DRAFT_482339 [Massarina eburnea CBS 473.64]
MAGMGSLVFVVVELQGRTRLAMYLASLSRRTTRKVVNIIGAKGYIRWGFLYLDWPIRDRREMVTAHIEELRKQLQGSSDFGRATNCFGRQHVDNMLATHHRIQESIFDGRNVIQFLKMTIEERFGVKDMPDGFLFFPVKLGDMSFANSRSQPDLKSPFVSLLQTQDSVKKNPYDVMHEYTELEREDYAQAKLQAISRSRS